MLIDGNTAYIMTSNFSRSALGGSSGSSGSTNREYGIIDTNPQDVQAVSTIFNADWNRTTAQFNAAQHGVHVEVILPAANGSSGDSNSQGIATIKQGGAQVREDAQLYMHAKIIVVDGRVAFVGSENISAESLDQNRELGIIVSDAAVLSKLQATFQKDWAVSQGV